MSLAIELPLWLVVILVAGCAYAVLMSALLPSVRWVLRRRLNRAIDRINTRLRIRIRPFQRTKRQVLIDRLSYDPQVLEAVERHARDSGTPSEVVLGRVNDYAGEIVPAFNAYVYYRVGYWLARRVSRFIYRIRVSAADSDRLAAVNPESTVVFVMNHRSNMDYLLVTYLAANQVTLSYAVGEWARVLPLKQLIKGLGGYFVRRNSNDPLYRKVLERYIHMSTKEGVSQAVYLEGGLSRDGRFAEPKLGFLDYMLRYFDAGTDRDIVFVPIGINYDHVLEDMNMLAWTDPQRRKGTWYHLKNVLSFLRHNLAAGREGRFLRNGYASVNFGIPVSAAEFVRACNIGFPDLDKSARFAQVSALANQLMNAIRHVMPILPVPLIATVIAQHADQRLRSGEIITAVNELIDRIIRAGAAMKDTERPRGTTILSSLELLKRRGILIEENDCFAVNPESRPLIGYYANSIAHWLESAAG